MKFFLVCATIIVLAFGLLLQDFGWVDQVSAVAAIQQVATIEIPNPKPYYEDLTDRDWFRGCLTAVDEQGNKTYGRMNPAG